MDVKKSVADLLNKDVDRREFLARVGAGILAIIGISSLIRAVSGHRTHGYGATDYGAKKEQ